MLRTYSYTFKCCFALFLSTWSISSNIIRRFNRKHPIKSVLGRVHLICVGIPYTCRLLLIVFSLSLCLSFSHSLIVFLASHRSINEEVKTYLSSKEGSKSIPTATLFPVSSSHLKICLMRTSDENRWLLSNVHWFGVAFQQLTINSLRMWNLLLNFHLEYLKSALFKWNPNTLRSN